MTSTTTITLTRPNTDDLFFYDSLFWENNIHGIIPVYTEFTEQGKIFDMIKHVSSDNLTSTRMIVFSNPEAKSEFGTKMCESIGITVDEFIKTRKDYCDSVGHTVVVTET
jgi:hypothetical protein